jgi:two-component system cell cycle sensor histidine kinase/response regulator CckA
MLPDSNQGNNSNSNRSILVLDDEIDIATIVKKSLQGLGFRVSAFTDPFVALEYFKLNFKICCSMVISDIRMPGLNGYEFAIKVKVIKPEIKVILMSAFEINDIELSNVLPGIKIDAFLQKPFSIRKLKGLIADNYLS